MATSDDADRAPAPADDPAPEHRGLVRRTRTRAEETWSRIEGARPRIPALDAAFNARAWDQEVGGGLLAGALAFRLFLWLVPFVFVLVQLLGLLLRDHVVSASDLGARFGITGVVASYVGAAADQSTTSSVFVMIVALYALYLASLGNVRALRVAHVLAWRMPFSRFHGTLAAALWFIGATTLLAAATAAINAYRDAHPGPGLALLLVFEVVVGGMWLLASWKLPHPEEVPVRALVPGAVLFTAGVCAVHIATVVWFTHKVEHSAELYGALGAAVGLLAWLYLLGRLMIASAVLNATLWRRRTAGSSMPPDPRLAG